MFTCSQPRFGCVQSNYRQVHCFVTIKNITLITLNFNTCKFTNGNEFIWWYYNYRSEQYCCSTYKMLTLRELQELAVRYFLRGNYVISLPTGSGKSLCYWLLPKAFYLLRKVHNQSIAVVVSLLVALMTDQVRAMSQWNVYACESDVTKDIAYGKYQLVFICPETYWMGSDYMMFCSDRCTSRILWG